MSIAKRNRPDMTGAAKVGRPRETYRGARRNFAKRLHAVWRVAQRDAALRGERWFGDPMVERSKPSPRAGRRHLKSKSDSG